MVGKGGGVAGLSLPLVETLGGPVGVGVAGAVLVVSITASRVVGKGGGVAGLSLPLVVAMASNGEAVAIVLGGVAVAVSGVAVVGEGTGRETEDNKLQCEYLISLILRTILSEVVLPLLLP